MAGRRGPVTDAHREIIQGIIDKRLAVGTHSTYDKAFAIFAKWLKDKYPASFLHDGSINFENFDVDQFLAFVTEKQTQDKTGIDRLSVHTFGVFRTPSSRPFQLFFQTYRSALQDYFKNHTRIFPAEWESRLADAYRGLHNTDADMRKRGERKATQGKEPLPFEVYKWLALQFIKGNEIFAWAYLVICWNLMSRASDVAEINFSHLTWKNDSLGVYMPKLKNDQGISLFAYFWINLSI